MIICVFFIDFFLSLSLSSLYGEGKYLLLPELIRLFVYKIIFKFSFGISINEKKNCFFPKNKISFITIIGIRD
jgi:hypothetical protein